MSDCSFLNDVLKVALSFALCLVLAGPNYGEERATKDRTSTPAIRVAVYTDTGAGKSKHDLLKALTKFENVIVQETTAEKIRSGGLDDVDVLIQPGGSGGKQGRHLQEDGREAIRKFVRNGGGYMGICAGAYLASSHYAWSLHILDAKVVDTKHWARGHGDVKISLTPTGQKVLRTGKKQLTILYWQGPLLAPGDRPELEDYQACALFETEIAENGAPKGVMKGTTAIASGDFGKGRVVCFSPHPERTGGLEYLVQSAIDHLHKPHVASSLIPANSRKRP